jgi:hypothetical protein
MKHPILMLAAGAGLIFAGVSPAAASVMEKLPAMLPDLPAGRTRGERNNNPGNIRYNPAFSPWQGQTGADAAGYLTFDTPENGIRAIGKDLLSKARRGLVTVRAIVTVYAPPSENNTGAYIKAVSDGLGVGADDPLDFADQDTVAAFVREIIQHENGLVNYTDTQIAAAIRSAFA